MCSARWRNCARALRWTPSAAASWGIRSEEQYSSVTEVLRIVTHFGKDAQVVPLEGADHFFVAAGTLGTMTQLVADFIAAHLIGEL